MGYMEPPPPSARQIIESYGGGGFKVGGIRHSGSVLIFPDETVAWPVAAAEEISLATLGPVLDRAESVRILIIGCGRVIAQQPMELTRELRAAGVGVEWMDTGAACRTFNVLLLEDREVAAALIAVD